MRKVAVRVAAMSLISASAFAIPYASHIRVSSTDLAPGVGADIRYVLNESADSVTIEIVPSGGGAAVATTTFNSPDLETTSGSHIVAWDGTDTFAAGTDIPDGTYRVQITVDNSVAAGWTEFSSNRSVAAIGEATTLETLFSGFSPKDTLIHLNPDNDLFGLILAASTLGAPQHTGHVPLLSDLNTLGGGDGLADLVLNNPGGYLGNQGVWGSVVDPISDEFVWATGQNSTAVNFMNADTSGGIPTDLLDADPSDFLLGQFPRSIAIFADGGARTALLTGGEGVMLSVAITSTPPFTASAAFGQIMSLMTTTRYSKDVEVDDAGNIYWASRRESSAAETGGRLYRWDFATVQAAIANPVGAPLTDANASWIVDVPVASTSVNGITIDRNGDVFLQVASDGIYNVANVSVASLTTTLGAGQLAVDFTAIGAGFVPSPFGSSVTADAVGNLYTVDSDSQQIRAFSPGGTTSETFPAPLSQTLTITTTTAVGDWSLYR
jgi:hypothetical protein